MSKHSKELATADIAPAGPIPFTVTGKRPPMELIPEQLIGGTVPEVMADYDAKNPSGDYRTFDDIPTVIRSGLTQDEAYDYLQALENRLNEDGSIDATIVSGRALVACVGDNEDPDAPLDFGVNVWIRPNDAGTWDVIDLSRGCGQLPWLMGCGWMAA